MNFPQIAPRGSATSFHFSPRGPQPGVLAVNEVMDAPRSVVARRLERDAVRNFEVAEPFEQLRVAHAVLEGDEHGAAFEYRTNRSERGLGRLRFHQDDHGIEGALAHLSSARENRELRHRLRAAGQREAVTPDRLDVRAVRVEHRNVCDFREVGRVKAAYRAGADQENALVFSHRMPCHAAHSKPRASHCLHGRWAFSGARNLRAYRSRSPD